MKHVIIFPHPKKNSFTASVASAFADAAAALGHSAVVYDLSGTVVIAQFDLPLFGGVPCCRA
jgi:putative NADPH-quinone reductase